MSVYKETLLLKRDFGGLVILFVMPLILIITITLIQDGTYKSMSDVKIPILLVDNDNDTISKTVRKNLNESGSFEVLTQLNGKNITEEVAQEAVFKGKYQLAIIIPEKLSSDLQLKVNQNVDKIISNFGLISMNSLQKANVAQNIKNFEIYLKTQYLYPRNLICHISYYNL